MTNPEFVTEIKKAIEAAFKKDPTFEGKKIEFYEGKPEVKNIDPGEHVEVYIHEATSSIPDSQYCIKTFISKYQLSVVYLFDETFSENIKNARSTSEWQCDINENLIITMVTKDIRNVG